MTKLVFDARESGTTSGRYVDKLIEYMHKLQPDMEVIVLAKEHRLEYLKKIAPSFTIELCSTKEFTFAEQLSLLWQIKRHKPDLVFFPFVQQPILYPGTAVTMLQDLTTVRFRNPTKNWLIFTIKQQVYKAVNIISAHKSKLLLTPTEFVKQDVVNFCHVRADKITVTLESADPITDKAVPFKELEGKDYIMYVGRPLPHKNLDRLVAAFQQLQNNRPHLRLVFVGKKDDSYERMEADVKTAGIKNVIFTDFISEGELRWLYEHTAAYVFPSLSEGFGLPPLEAMLHGAPVVSSNATCLPEVNKDAAIYFDPLDVTDMAVKIETVLDDPKFSKELTDKGHVLAKTYSWERMAQQTLDVFAKALKQS